MSQLKPKSPTPCGVYEYFRLDLWTNTNRDVLEFSDFPLKFMCDTDALSKRIESSCHLFLVLDY